MMIIIFFIVCVIEFIIQILSITELKKTGDSKYWNIFIGMTLASFISNAIAFTVFCIDEGLDLSKAFLCLIVCAVEFFSNLILLFVGLIIKNKIKSFKIKTGIKSLFVGLLTILLTIILLIIIPSIKNKIYNYIISKNVITYLNNKYGDHNFEITGVYEDYSYTGFNKYFSGYNVYVSTPLLKDEFTIFVHNTNFKESYNLSEKFVGDYYNEKTNAYLSQKYDLEFNIEVNKEKIPNNGGYVPTIDELIKYDAISHIYIEISYDNNFDYDFDESETINYIKDLSLDIIEYLNISNDVKFEFRSTKKNLDNYDIIVTGNALKIIDINKDNKKEYEFDINK